LAAGSSSSRPPGKHKICIVTGAVFMYRMLCWNQGGGTFTAGEHHHTFGSDTFGGCYIC
jgi:hypothetical protein